MLFFVLEIAIIGFICAYLYLKFVYTYWNRRGIPYISSSVPLGSFIDVVTAKKCMGEFYLDIYNRSEEPAIGIFQIHNPTLVLRDPDLIKHVLVKDFNSFLSHGAHVNEDFDPLSAHLFALSGKRWKSLRVKLTPTFSSGKIKMMLPILASIGDELSTHLNQYCENNQPAEMKEILARFTTDVIASCAFGITCNSLKDPNAEFRKWGKKAFDPNLKTLLRGVVTYLLPTVSKLFKVPSIPKDVTQFFQRIVRETIKYREENNVTRYDFMQLLIQLKNFGSISDNDSWTAPENDSSNNEGLDETEIVAQSFIFFLAGFETSSTTLTFCFYELAVNLHIQDQLRNEINLVLRQNGGIVTYDAIQRMRFLDKVISETLRKYPPLPFLNRVCTKPYAVPGTNWKLEEGTALVVPLLGIHRDSKYYPDPETFDPERFSDDAKSKRHPFSYLPFGEGPRICIGMRFGILQAKIGVVSLLRNYKIGICNKTPIPMTFDHKSFFLSPRDNCMWLQLSHI